MFTGLMLNTWIAGTAVAIIAGVTGFFAVLRGSTFAAHAPATIVSSKRPSTLACRLGPESSSETPRKM